jgi:chromosome partitioning protein
MILSIVSRKGGVGKTTLATNISTCLVLNHKDVLIVDSDKQHSASNWALERSEQELPKINWTQQHDNIAVSLRDFQSRYEYVIVDAAGRDSMEMRSSMLVADALLIPCRPAQFDLDTLPYMVELINQARMINPNLLAYCVISMSPGTSKGDTRDAIKFIKQYSEMQLLETVIGDRKIYRDSSACGMGVVELQAKTASDNAGKEEMNSLMGELWR